MIDTRGTRKYQAREDRRGLEDGDSVIYRVRAEMCYYPVRYRVRRVYGKS